MTKSKNALSRKKLSRFAAAAVVSLLAVLASGCSRNTDTPALKTKDLGTIELRAGWAKNLDLGERKECWLVASPATNYEFSVDITINVRSYVGIVDKEQTKSARVTAHTGRECVVQLGDTAFQFKPVLTAE